VERVIAVGLGELVVSADAQVVLTAYGLGSCVGVSAHDAGRSAGGLLHAMLPRRRNGDANLAKYVESGVPELLERLLALGCRREHLIWRYAGGAQMLVAPGLSDRFNIGQQNVAVTQEIMAALRLRPSAQDVGGHQGRTVRLFIAGGRFTVSCVNGEGRAL
jgi:chemotaxis protein CheD